MHSRGWGDKSWAQNALDPYPAFLLCPGLLGFCTQGPGAALEAQASLGPLTRTLELTLDPACPPVMPPGQQ